MGEQLELFEKPVEWSDEELQLIDKEIHRYVEPKGFGIISKYFKDNYHNIHYWVRCHFKYPYQRIKYGFADNDVWGLNSYLTDVIIGSVTKLRSNPMGHPCQFNSLQEWQTELDEIIKAFDDYKNYDDNSHARLDVLHKQHNIPTWQEVASGELGKFTDYLNNPKYKLPRDVYKKFWDDELVIHNNIKKRMKRIIDVWDNLWD